MINNRNPISQTIHERIVEPARRSIIYPDIGFGHRSQGFFRTRPGAIDKTAMPFWEEIVQAVESVAQVFGLSGGTQLVSDEIVLDVVVRTPYGNKIIPNLPLNINAIDKVHTDEINDRLNKLGSIMVKIQYDGGKPSECSPISWKFQETSAVDIINAIDTSGITGSASSFSVPLNQIQSMIEGESGGSWGVPPQGSLGLPFFTHGTSPLAPYISIINQAGISFHVDPALVAAITMAESTGQAKIVSSAGAIGLMQLEPGTFKSQYAIVSQQFPGLANDIHDPQTNVFCGTYYLSTLLDRYKGNTDGLSRAIAAYNAGPGAVDAANGVPNFSETRSYVRRVLGYWQQFQQESSFALSKPTIENNRPEGRNKDQTGASTNSAKSLAAGSK